MSEQTVQPGFNATLEPWQYKLEVGSIPGAHLFGGFSLSFGPDVHLIPLEDSQGVKVGAIFGFAIDLESKTALRKPHRLSFARGTDPDAFAEKVLRAIAGRFVWFFITDDIARIYLDCAGLVPCVYDPKLKIAGTTAAVLFDEETYQARFDHYIYDRFRVGVDGFMAAGRTAHQGLIRLLPNHYLDLKSWAPKRHWSVSMSEPVGNPREAIAEIISIVRDQIEALLGSDLRVAQALTAGHETRMLLGIAKPFIKDIDFVTVVGSDRHAVDSIMASRIAKSEGLNHRKLQRVTASEEARQVFIRRGGNCVVDSNSYYAPSVAPIADTHNFVGGLGGELARAFFWHDQDSAASEITPQRLLNRFGQPYEKQMHAPLQQWLDDLPEDNALDILDMAYVEHRMGPWSGGQFCNDPTLVRYAPLFTRRCSELMLGLPDDWKRHERMSSEAVSQTWPELADYPYNFVSNWHSFSAKAHRVIADPWVILRRLRKMRK
jgi:hypothetical protein